MNMEHRLVDIVAIALVATGFTGCKPSPPVYSSAPVSARVVDASSGEPIAGVAVVAYWELRWLSSESFWLCGTANVEEAVTDKDGWFHLPGWQSFKGGCGGMLNTNPYVYLFKPGYAYESLSSDHFAEDIRVVPMTTATWDGTTVTLDRFAGFPNPDLSVNGKDSYAKNFDDLSAELEPFIVYLPGECNWKKIPYMLQAIVAERRAFNSAGNHHVYSMDLLLTRSDQDRHMQEIAPQCGSPQRYVEDLEKWTN